MTVQERIAQLIGLHLSNEPVEVNGADLVLDVERIVNDSVFFNVRVFGSEEIEGRIVVPVITLDCEHLDQYVPEDGSVTGD